MDVNKDYQKVKWEYEDAAAGPEEQIVFKKEEEKLSDIEKFQRLM
jgi:hypothetical protein